MRVLFIIKKGLTSGSGYGGYNEGGVGLFDSATFVASALSGHGIETKVVEVLDNNYISHEVAQFQPDVVVIEALWVVPSKFAVLTRIHPHVKWVVRIHSEIPFLAIEGIAIDWIKEYLKYYKVRVAANQSRAFRDIQIVGSLTPAPPEHVVYLPDCYQSPTGVRKPHHRHDEFHVGCFGAIRSFKNNLLQAIAAIEFAELTGKNLHFHINATRPEQDGAHALSNIRALFKNTKFTLVEDPWMGKRAFLEKLRAMDIVMAVSLSETFCIVAADAAALGVPLVCSPEITWASRGSKAQTMDSESIVKVMTQVLSRARSAANIWHNRRGLTVYNQLSTEAWLEFLEHKRG